MPRVGNGTYLLPASYLAAPGTAIKSAEQHNIPFVDVQDALTNSVARDGQTLMIGNLRMNSNKITDLLAGVAPSDAARVDQIIEKFYTWDQVIGSPTASIGAFTNASYVVRYRVINKTAFFNVVVTIIGNGTASGTINVPLPFASVMETAVAGRESQTTGVACTGTIVGSNMSIYKYDNSYAGGNSLRIAMSGVAELA